MFSVSAAETSRLLTQFNFRNFFIELYYKIYMGIHKKTYGKELLDFFQIPKCLPTSELHRCCKEVASDINEEKLFCCVCVSG